MSEPGRKGDLLILAHVVVLVVVIIVVAHLATGCSKDTTPSQAAAASVDPWARPVPAQDFEPAPARTYRVEELADARDMCALGRLSPRERDAAVDTWWRTRKRSAGFTVLIIPTLDDKPDAIASMRAMAAAAVGSNECDPWIDTLFTVGEGLRRRRIDE